MIVSPLWPYVNDYLDIRWLQNPLFSEPVVWVSVRPTGPIAGGSASACTCHLYYRLTPAIYAKFAAAVEKLTATKEKQTTDVIAAASALVDLGTWLAHSSGEFTAVDLVEAHRAVATGTAPPMPKPPASKEELLVIDRIIARDAAANAVKVEAFDSDKWLKSWGR